MASLAGPDLYTVLIVNASTDMSRRRRRRAVAVAAAAVALLMAAAAPAVARKARVGARSAASTPGATSVLSYGADPSGAVDSTAAFLNAEDAALATTVRYESGPTGAPQAVVYVPPGTYRLLRLPFRSNLRMEVSSGAVLEQAGGRSVTAGAAGPPALIVWDGPGATPLTNVTLIGVADSADGPKALAAPLYPGWSVDSDFTIDLDPAATNASVLVTGMLLYNVSGFLIENVFSIENDFQPATTPVTDDGWWPQSRKAALSLVERPDTPSNGSVFYDPHDGTIDNWYNVNGPKGFGPNQINAGHDLNISHIFTRGGTALRLETDASLKKTWAAEIRGLTASDIVGQNCNRAVVFAPHSQTNYDVHVSDVRSDGCNQGVLESVDEAHKAVPGAFVNATISDVQVTAGTQAQVGTFASAGSWIVGQSTQAFGKDKSISTRPWAVVYTAGTYSCTGAFAKRSNVITTTAGRIQPKCH